MGKISPVSIKYVVYAKFKLSGIAERPDIIGAIFGQTEGLLGSNLELRELQKSGRIGRIDVKVENKDGKTSGEIILPSSMGKTETAIIGASLETIERVGPCEAKIVVNKIDDVRVSKRDFVKDRAQELLKTLVADMPDSQEFANLLTESFRSGEIVQFGKDKLAAGPEVETSNEIVIVEGRADVLNLLRYGIKNAVAMQGTKIPQSIIDLTKEKSVTLFVDGDRGGELIIKKLADLTDLEFVAFAPDGKEVEELTQKEILKSLRMKIKWDEAKAKVSGGSETATVTERPRRPMDRPNDRERKFDRSSRLSRLKPSGRSGGRFERRSFPPREPRSDGNEEKIGEMANDLEKDKSLILDKNLKVMGKVPTDELADTLENLDGVYAVVIKGSADNEIQKVARDKHIRHVVAKA